MTRAAGCQADGCSYAKQGFPACTGGCVEAGHGDQPPFSHGFGVPGVAAAMAAAMGRTRHLSSRDSGTGTEHHSTDPGWEFEDGTETPGSGGVTDWYGRA